MKKYGSGSRDVVKYIQGLRVTVPEGMDIQEKLTTTK